jgi:bis(5'-nucleosidyl)-tetraphosphatase
MKERAAGFVVFFLDEGEPLYLLLRSSTDGCWGLPKGKLDSGENDLQAARRELLEETGIADLEVLKGFERRIAYQFEREGQEFDKAVRYFLARARSREVAISAEHSEYGWFLIEDARERIVFDNLRAVMDAAHSFILAQR